MTRRLILATCLLGVIGGTASTALASPVKRHPHQLCVVLSKTDHTTQDYCIDWNGTPAK